MQVWIIVRKDILNIIIIENRTDWVSHLYFIILDIKKLNSVFGKYLGNTRDVNLYNNKISNGYI